jgi:TonB-linked SusC/RagA family outer membrane protein
MEKKLPTRGQPWFIATLLLSFLIALALTSMATPMQTGTRVSGKITDELGTGLPGVNVVAKGTTNGTTTNADGDYVIQVAGGNAVLSFSFIGYTPQEIAIGTQTQISISMKPELKLLDEVVVVGYGTQQKDKMVSAVSNVSGEQLRNIGLTNVSQGIQDLLPGVIASIQSGQPGADNARLTIRGVTTFNGTNEPLVLVDNIEVTGGFSAINPGEIASISALKDASATAIYGTRGANGVILITTRRGKTGEPTITVSANVTAKIITDMPEQLGSYDILTAGQIAIKNSGGFDKLRSDRWIANFKDPNRDPMLYPSVDWYKEMLKPMGFENTARVTLSGGNEFVKYFNSLSYDHVGDMFKVDNAQGTYNPGFYYDKINFRTNLDFALTKTTNLRTDIAGRTEKTNSPGNASLDLIGNGADQNLFKILNQTSPYLFPPYYDEEFIKRHPDPFDPNAATNGIRIAQLAYTIPYQWNSYARINYTGLNVLKKEVLDLKLGLDEDLKYVTPGLKVFATFNYSTSFAHTKTYSNDTDLWYFDSIKETWYKGSILPGVNYNVSPLGYHPSGGEGYSSSSRNLYYELKTTYDRSFGLNTVGFVGVFNRTEYRADVETFPSYLENWVGRATYDYGQKYLLEVSAGYNGSEKFAPGKRFGFFPSAAVGWNLTNEKFLERFTQDNTWLNMLKIRYSVGKTGNERNAGRFLYEGGWAPVPSRFSIFSPGLPLNPTIQRILQLKTPNPDATWETGFKQNLGFDIKMFNKDLSMTIELYNETRTGILLTDPLLSYYHPGFFADPAFPAAVAAAVSNPPSNKGETKSQGLEFVTNYSHTTSRKFTYSVGGNFNINESRIIYRADPALRPEYQSSAGKPIGWLSGYQTNGYINSFEEAINAPAQPSGNIPGGYYWADFNANGLIDGNDQIPLKGTEQPFITYGFNFGFQYKGLSISARFYGKGGLTIEANRAFIYPVFDVDRFTGRRNQMDTWSFENKNAPFPAYSNGFGNGYLSAHDLNRLSGDYLRLKRVSINYLFQSVKLQNKLKVKSIELYLTSDNLYTWTEIPSGDPEGGNSVKDAGNYPLVKRFVFGTNINF